MNFAEPKFLWLLLAVCPLLGLFLWWTWRRRQQLISQFVQNRFLAELTLGVSSGRQKARRILLFFAVGLLLLALARPQWGFTWEEASIRGRDIIVAIDTSRSMMAADIQPNRLARAKLAALDLLQLARYDRLGLVAFAGTAFLQCPLTMDDEAFRQSVEILEPGIIPQGGSALAEAIETARRSFSESEGENHRIIVLFTDGEDHEEGALEQARRAAEGGVRIFTIGVGTAAGELLRVADESGRMVFLKDVMGNAVKSRLNEGLLQQIATAADGFYLPLQGGNPMQVLYEKGLEPLPTSERSTKLLKQFKEQYYWPLGLAIFLLLLELFLPDRKRVAKSTTGAPAAAAVLFLVLMAMPGVEASSASALKKYRAGDYRRALEEYRTLAEKEPLDARLQYNAGAAAYQAGELDYALSKFQGGAASPDLEIQQRSFYNMGNALFRLGDQNPNVQERMQSWEQAIAAYEAALKLSPQDEDARYNKELVRKKLEELKKQQEQEEQQQQQQQNNQDQDQQDNQQNEQKDQDQSEQKNQEGGEEQDQKNNSEQEQEQERGKEEQEQQQQEQERAGNEQEQSQQQRPGSGEQQEETAQNPESGEQGEMAQLGQMTPAQARQLLDAQKGEEKALLFVPEAKKSSPRNRVFKDW